MPGTRHPPLHLTLDEIAGATRLLPRIRIL
jgi:hypothetical protein